MDGVSGRTSASVGVHRHEERETAVAVAARSFRSFGVITHVNGPIFQMTLEHRLMHRNWTKMNVYNCMVLRLNAMKSCHFTFNPRPVRAFLITRTVRGGWYDPPGDRPLMVVELRGKNGRCASMISRDCTYCF